jgi:hypothetical protein
MYHGSRTSCRVAERWLGCSDEARGISCLTMISTTPPADAMAPYISAGPLYFGEFKARFVREGGVWKFLERRGSVQMKFPGATA